MKVIEDVQQWRDLRKTLDGRIGFVPTMGALHDGHASLLRRSVAEQDITVLSIYVNPTQFNDPKDLASYPDMLDDDLALAAELGVDIVILPRYGDIYADENLKITSDDRHVGQKVRSISNNAGNRLKLNTINGNMYLRL